MITCAVGFTFLFSSIYLLLKNDNIQEALFNQFETMLSNDQINKYESIIRERVMIYLTGSFLGIICALFYYLKNKNDTYLVCKLLMILYIVKLGYYKIAPKQPLMLYSLNTKEQKDKWADIYTYMQKEWIQSLVIGFVGYLIIGMYICQGSKKCY